MKNTIREREEKEKSKRSEHSKVPIHPLRSDLNPEVIIPYDPPSTHHHHHHHHLGTAFHFNATSSSSSREQRLLDLSSEQNRVVLELDGLRMAIADGDSGTGVFEGKVRSLCKMPFWHTAASGGTSGNVGSSISSNSSSSLALHNNVYGHGFHGDGSRGNYDESSRQQQSSGGASVSSVARSFLPKRRRLRLDPSTKLYFPYEPGKQVRSAIKIKNISKSHVAFKFQTTAPKSCFMRPPGCILAPDESIIATVFKFVEHPENNEKQADQKCKVKFKILSLKVKGQMDYVPELFDEQKDYIAVEQLLRVVFLDPEKPSPQMEKLKRQLAEAEAALEARKKSPEEAGPRIVGEGLVIDEWKERRERYLARQQGEGVDSA